MAILKDLIVHGSSRFLNKIYASEIQTPLIEAEAGIIKKLKADDVTVVGLLDVQGQMHTSSWTNSNIATIDGSFYITPTIGSDSGTVTITATSLNFSGTNYAVTSLYLGDNSSITWPQYSKVLVTGQILSNGEWIPLGTLLGQLSATAAAASIKINNIKDNKNQTSSVLATLVNNGTTSSDYRNLKVSLYQRASSSTAFYPLGIYITATGDNGRTFLDIYGGVESLENNANHGGFAEPNVRIGNLQGLPNVGGQTPSGWGIYTDNGYFKGIIAADRGYIGSGSRYWVIANYEDGSNPNNSRSYIYNNTDSVISTVEGIYLGTDGIRNYKDSTHYVTIKDGVITALGVNLTGQITATSGTIGGASIMNGILIVGNANINDINASKINAGDIAAARIQTNLISAINAKVSDLSALTATIGGFQIDSSSVHTNNVAVTSNADNSIALSSADFTRTINSISRAGLRFAIGDKFGVTGDGTIYASNVDLKGKIIATSGTIGGIQLDSNGKLWIKDANISGKISGNHIDVSSISIGSLNGVNNYAQKTDVTNAIDNLQIGGRNLLRYDVKNYAFSASKIIEGESYRGMYASIEEGKTYTISRKIVEGNRFRLYTTQVEPAVNIAAQALKVDDDTLLKYTFVAPSGANYLFIYLSNQSDNISDGNIKLEKGNKATDWTPAPEDTQENINNISTVANTALGQSVWYAECPTAAGTAVKVATVSPVTTAFPNPLVNGTTVNVKFTETNSAINTSLKLNVNGTGEKSIKYIYNGAITNIVAGYLKANQMYQFRYDGTYWIVQMMRNTNDFDRSLYEVALQASEAIPSASIAVLGLDEKLHLLNSSSFRISCPLLYVGNAYSADNVTNSFSRATNYTYWGTPFNLTNTHSIQNAIANTNVYVVGTLLGDIFTPSTTVLTCVEPTTEDGLYYMLLGRMTSTTKAILQAEHPIYIYKNGNFQKLEATTATSYITYIDANNGIKIHNESDTLNYIQLNSTAISMFRDSEDGINSDEVLRIEDNEVRIGKINGNNVFINNTSVNIREGQNTLASFGIDGIQIGLDNETRTEQDYHSWKMIDKDDNIYAFVSDLRDEYGEATITEIAKPNQASSWTETNFEISSIISVTVNGEAPESYRKILRNLIEIQPEPTDGDVVVVTYTSQSPELKAYTFGKRIQNSNIGGYSFVEGVNNVASNYTSHAEGNSNTSSGEASHVEGILNIAQGRASHAQNFNTTASSDYQTTIGKYNVNDPNNQYAFIIGNGGPNRVINEFDYSNALAIGWNGNMEIGGGMFGTLVENSDPVHKLPTRTPIPLFKTMSWNWDNQIIGNNSGWFRGAFNIYQKGYSALGVVGFGVYPATENPANIDQCIIIKCYTWYNPNVIMEDNHVGGDILDVYVWNRHQSQNAKVNIFVKVLYIAESAFLGVSEPGT